MMADSQPLSGAPEGAEYLRAVLRAPVYEAAQVTPLQKMEKLSSRLDNVILVKREDRQPVHSFKLRGAYAMMAGLTEEQKAHGVITASAGNHAQGVAFSSARLGVKALIVMPTATADIKVDAVRGFGGEVLLHGANFDEAKAKAIELSQQQGFTWVPPFDHPMVIAGQGTLALELLQQDAHLDRVFVPVGGGGLAAGVAVLIKQLMPQIKVIAVEAEDSACLKAALDAGHPVDLPRVGLFAEGVAVKRIGDETFRLCQEYLDDIITVDSDAICAAMKDLFEDVRAVAEPSGALALAGMKKYIAQHNIRGERLAHILSGANVNFHGLRYVSERCELGEQREALLAVTIPEEKGSFLKFCQLLGGRSVTEFNYRFADAKNACIFVGVRLSSAKKFCRCSTTAATAWLISPTMKWRSYMCAIWLAGVHRIRCRNVSTASNFRNRRVRCCASSTRWVRTGIFLCSIIAVTVPTTGAYWRRSSLATMNRISKPG